MTMSKPNQPSQRQARLAAFTEHIRMHGDCKLLMQFDRIAFAPAADQEHLLADLVAELHKTQGRTS